MSGSRSRLALLIAAALLPPSLWGATINGTVLTAGTTTALSGANVVLSSVPAGGGARTPVDTVQTDAAGKFAFTVAAAQNYGIAVTLTGYLPYSNNNIDLAADTSVVDLAISLAVIPPPADISGTVVGADSTTAVAGATVVLTRPGTGGGGGGGPRVPVDTMQTDAAGKFAFPDLAALDNYGLTVSATGFETYTNNNIDLEGRDTALTIRLTPPPPPAAIGGTVVGADSTTAVAGATVVLTRPGTGGGGARVPVDTMQTDAAGKFSFPALPALDNYGLTVTATGFQTYTNNNIDLDGRDTSLSIRLTPPPAPGTITGTVYASDSATAVANATVILTRAGFGGGGGGGGRIPVDTAQTDAQGKFTFTGVTAGDNLGLAVNAAGFQLYVDNNVDLAAGATVTVNVRLAPPGAPGAISGTVRTGGANPAPIANATVILRTPALAGGLPLDTAATNAQGQYSFTGVPSLDNYILSVSATGYQNATNSNVDVDSADTATVNFTLIPTASVRYAASGPSLKMAWAGHALAVRFAASPQARVLSVHGMTGAQRYRATIPPHGTAILVPGEVLKEKGLALVLAAPGDRKVFMLPRR